MEWILLPPLFLQYFLLGNKASAQISLTSFLGGLDFQNFSYVLSLKQLVLFPTASTSVLGHIWDDVVELYFCSALYSSLSV